MLFFEFFVEGERIGEVGVEAVGQLGTIAICSMEGNNVDIIKVVICAIFHQTDIVDQSAIAIIFVFWFAKANYCLIGFCNEAIALRMPFSRSR